MSASRIFECLQTQGRFWNEPQTMFPQPQDVMMSDQLYTQSQGKMTFKKYVVTAARFIEVQSQNEGVTNFLEGDIQWCTVERCRRDTRLLSLSGFAIYHKFEKLVFYAMSDFTCEKWLRHLQRLTVLRNIDRCFTLKTIIEDGKFCKVVEGCAVESGEQVTIKQIPKVNILRSPRRYQSIVNEIRILRSLSHRNVAKLHCVYESEDHVLLIFEHLQGQLLSDSINQQRFSESEAKSLALALLDLLIYLGQKSVLHRDFKPRNFLLTDPRDRSQFKLIDFSIARMCGDDQTTDSLGSPGFIAPEVLTTGRCGPAADLYSAGIVLYMVVAGSSQVKEGNKLLLAPHLNSELPLSPEWSTMDKKLLSVVRIMTSANPASRMTASRLKGILLSAETTDMLPLFPPIKRKPKRRLARKTIDFSVCGEEWSYSKSLAISMTPLPRVNGEREETYAQWT